MIKPVLALLAVVALAAGCAQTTPQSTVSRNLESGVTANNGGGMAPANFGSTAPVKVRRAPGAVRADVLPPWQATFVIASRFLAAWRSIGTGHPCRAKMTAENR